VGSGVAGGSPSAQGSFVGVASALVIPPVDADGVAASLTSAGFGVSSVVGIDESSASGGKASSFGSGGFVDSFIACLVGT